MGSDYDNLDKLEKKYQQELKLQQYPNPTTISSKDVNPNHLNQPVPAG